MDKLNFTIVTTESPAVLSKSFRLTEDGQLEKKPAPGMLLTGHARRYSCASIVDLDKLLGSLNYRQAVCWGVAEHAEANLVTKKALPAIDQNNITLPCIVRTREHFRFAGVACLMLDHDRGLSDIELLHGIETILPEISNAPYLIRPSASSNIYCRETGEQLRGQTGLRLLLLIRDGTDLQRAAAVLDGRAWLQGFGRVDISKAGSLLVRNQLFDTSVFQPERLDFCGGAHCDPGLEQRLTTLKISNHAQPLDTRTALPDLTAEEKQRVKDLIQTAKEEAKPAAKDVQDAWVEDRVQSELAGQPELTDSDREALRDKLTELFRPAAKFSRLHGDFEIILENGKTVTVGQMLDSPDKFHNMRCADPLEPAYKNDKRIAWINLHAAGRPYIYSHAHGGRRFTLVRSRVTIQLIPGERYHIVTKILDLLKLDGTLYHRGGELVQIDDDGTILPINTDGLQLITDRTARFEKIDKRSETIVPADCPLHIGKGLMAARALWRFPNLTATATAPAYDPKTGRVIDRDGYDSDTGLMLVARDLSAWPGVPVKPTLEHCEAALDHLMRPFCSFPFRESIDLSVWISTLLTAAVRPLLPTAPATGINAPVVSSGKTLLARSACALAGTDSPSVMPITEQPEEIRKALLSVARTGAPAMLIDNINGYFESNPLCAFLTSPHYTDRVLGFSQVITVPTSQLTLLTGNNLTLKGDLCRRVLRCSIDPEVEAPWKRCFTIHPVEHCRTYRFEMLAACYTLMRAARNAGASCPNRTGSFELWSDSVRATILWLNKTGLDFLPDPCDSIDVSFQDDPETAKLGELLRLWHEMFGQESKTVNQVLSELNNAVGYDDLRECIELISGERGSINPRKLGAWIRKNQGRIVGGLRIVDSKSDFHKVKRWSVDKCS